MTNSPQQTLKDLPFIPEGNRALNSWLLRNNPLRLAQMLGRGGDLFRLPLLDKNVVAVIGPAALQQVLVDNAFALEKAALFRLSLYPFLGDGLFTARRELWRRQRKLMAPIFAPAQIAHFAECMVGCALRDASAWQDGSVVDMARATMRITMSVAGKTLFDADTFSEADDLGAAMTVALRWSTEQLTTPLSLLQVSLRQILERLEPALPGQIGTLSRELIERMQSPLLMPGEKGRRTRAALSLLDRRIQRMIDERRQSGHAGTDLLGRLLTAQDDESLAHMNDRQLRDEVLTLFLAGHETTATSLAWSLYLLTRHPEVYRSARAEADALSHLPRFEDVPRLPLIQRVFKEAIRLYTPFPMFNRDLIADIEVCGHRLPAGSVLLFSPYTTHHRADLWPDPERFDPDRFTPAAESARPRYAYVPFSTGPRVCIGNHFATMEGTLVLAALLQHADFELACTSVKPQIKGTLRPKDGIPMRVRLRSHPVASATA